MTFIRNRRNKVVLAGAIAATLIGGLVTASELQANATASACNSTTYSYTVTLTNLAAQSVTLHGIQNVMLRHDLHANRAKLDDPEYAKVKTDFKNKLPTDGVTFTKLFETTTTGLQHEKFLAGLAHRQLASAVVTVLNGSTVVDQYRVAPAYVAFVTHTPPAAGKTALPTETMGIISPALKRLMTGKINAGKPTLNKTGFAYKTKINYTNTADQPASHTLIPTNVDIEQDSADAENNVDSAQLTEFADDAGAPPAASISMTVPYNSGDNTFNEFALAMDASAVSKRLTSANVSVLDNDKTDIQYKNSIPRFPSLSLLFPKFRACAATSRPIWKWQGIVKTLS